MLNVSQVLSRSFQLFMHNPLGILWLQLQAIVISAVTLGILAGPMQVGVYSVLLGYIRRGEWQPGELWGKTTRQNILAGLVYVAFFLAVLVVGLPFSQAAPWIALIFGFVTALAVNLIWFYTFQVLTDQSMHWIPAIRRGWDLMQQGGFFAHFWLIVFLQFLNSLPTDTVPIPIQAIILLVLFTYATLCQAVAYGQLVTKTSPQAESKPS